MEFVLKPIGVIHSPFLEKSQVPIQASRSKAKGTLEIYPEYIEGLQDLKGFSHIILLYIFHKSSGYSLLVKLFLDDQLHGLFATRYPLRPNPSGLSIVRLETRYGSMLDVEGVDVLDGTPLVDIKPYVPEFDERSNTCMGWYNTRKTE